MRNLKPIIATVALAATFTACSNNETENGASQDGRTPLTITAGITSRAADAEWQSNDALGLILFNNGTFEPCDNKANYRYVTADGKGTFNAADEQNRAYLPSGGANADLVAYYPYSSAVSATNLNVPVDVTSQTNLPAIDLMAADKVAGLNASKSSASLAFSHKLCKLVFRVAKDETATAIDLAGATAVLKGTRTKASWNLTTNSLSTSGDNTDIALPMTNDGTSATAIVLPTDKGAGKSITLTTKKGEVYNVAINETLALNAGTVNTYTMTLHRHEATITASIAPWTTGVETGDTSLLDVISGGSNITLPAGIEGRFILATKEGTEDVTVDYDWDGTTLKSNATIYWEQLSQTAHTFNAIFVPKTGISNNQSKDYLTATAKDVAFGKAVNLTMNHAMARFIVKLSSDGTYTADELKGATISFNSALTTSYSPNTAILTISKLIDAPAAAGGGHEYHTVTMINASAAADATATFTAITCPETITAITLTIAGKTFTLTKDMTLTAGQTYTLNAAVGKTTIKVGTVTVADWAVGTTTDGTFQY